MGEDDVKLQIVAVDLAHSTCALQVSLPSFRVGLPAYYVIATSEASANLARFDGVRYGPRHEARALPCKHSAWHAIHEAGFLV